MLREGSAPTPAQLQTADGVFCGILEGRGALSLSEWKREWSVAIDNLAFVCTYGKKNCLTNAMYTGELSLRKICSLVYGKLSEGVVRC